jgi:nitroreductase
MDAFLAIVSRREVRDYDGRPLPDDAVLNILEAGRLAGSSGNRQQRRFVVLRAARDQVADAVYTPSNVRGAALAVAIVVAGRGPTALDAGRAAQNMLLAAHALGVGSCPNGVADAEAMAQAVGVAEGEKVATVLTFGYPARGSRDPARRPAAEWIARADRRPFDEVVSER